jgi:hypothetical protein
MIHADKKLPEFIGRVYKECRMTGLLAHISAILGAKAHLPRALAVLLATRA